MSIFGSLLWGREGSYSILGIETQFSPLERGDIERLSNPKDSFESRNIVEEVVDDIIYTCYTSPTFRVLTLDYFQTFIHEMGHALAAKLNHSKEIEVRIHTDFPTGTTSHKSHPERMAIITFAGPALSTAFACSKLAIGRFLRHYSRPVAYFLETGAVINMLRELSYSTKRYGDFDKLRKVHWSLPPLGITLLVYACVSYIYPSLVSK